ncbi:MAG: hypothetical protein OSB68_08510 [Dehalococcoidia bacterium]|nr:hypothetical protein [Dehalococcoidia bacterium]
MLLGLVGLAVTGCSGGRDGDPSDPTALPGSTAAAVPIGTVKSSSSGGSENSYSGTLEVRVTYAPGPSITAVYVTTDNIEVSIAGEGWVSVIDEEITFEILAL